MPQNKYEVELTDGRKFIVEASAPPSEQDVLSALGSFKPEPQPEQTAAATPEEKSLSGFAGNVLESGGRFIGDTVKGALSIPGMLIKATTGDPVKSGQAVIDALKAAPGAIADYAKTRYGGLEQAGNTLYEDPVGVLGDISTLASGGAMAAAKAPRIAGTLGKIGAATNPLNAIMPAVAKATEYGTAAAIRPLLSPPKGLIRQTRAPLEIERTALKTGAVTEKLAGRKTGAAAARSTKMADEATAAGVTIPRGQVAQFPKTLKKVENLTPNIKPLDDLAALETDTIATLPPTLTPSEALTRRRALDEAVDSAYRAEERGGYVRSVADKGQKELAGNLRGAVREAVPGIAASDDEARRLMLVTKALKDAGERAKTIPMSAALAGGGAAALGVPAAAPAAAVAIGRTWPQLPLALGSVPVRGAAALSDAELMKVALLARMLGQQ